jgi:hypothetical protein
MNPNLSMIISTYKVLLLTLAPVLSAVQPTLESTSEMRQRDELPVEDNRSLLLLTRVICNQVQAATPGAECNCRRPGLGRGFTVDCVNNVATCILLVGCFTLKYSGEFFPVRKNRSTSSELCLTEVNSNFGVFCIKGIHCGSDFNGYTPCSAKVGNTECNSCAVCPGGSGLTVDCNNVNPILT